MTKRMIKKLLFLIAIRLIMEKNFVTLTLHVLYAGLLKIISFILWSMLTSPYGSLKMISGLKSKRISLKSR